MAACVIRFALPFRWLSVMFAIIGHAGKLVCTSILIAKQVAVNSAGYVELTTLIATRMELQSRTRIEL